MRGTQNEGRYNLENKKKSADGQLPNENLSRQALELSELEIMLKMSSAFAHEVSQPLTVMVSNLDLLLMRRNQLDIKTQASLEKMSIAAQGLADLIKRTQNIFQNHPKAIESEIDDHFSGSDAIRFGLIIEDSVLIQKIEEFLDGSDMEFELFYPSVRDLSLAALAEFKPRIVLLDYTIVDGTVMRFVQDLGDQPPDFPLAFLTDSRSERIMAGLLRGAVYDYLPKTVLNRNNFLRMIQFAILRFEIISQLAKLSLKIPPAAD